MITPSETSTLDSARRSALVSETALRMAGWFDSEIEAFGEPARTVHGERFWRLDAVNAALEARFAGQTDFGTKTGG